MRFYVQPRKTLVMGVPQHKFVYLQLKTTMAYFVPGLTILTNTFLLLITVLSLATNWMGMLYVLPMKCPTDASLSHYACPVIKMNTANGVLAIQLAQSIVITTSYVAIMVWTPEAVRRHRYVYKEERIWMVSNALDFVHLCARIIKRYNQVVLLVMDVYFHLFVKVSKKYQ